MQEVYSVIHLRFSYSLSLCYAERLMVLYQLSSHYSTMPLQVMWDKALVSEFL